MSKPKKKPLQVYLTEIKRQFVESESITQEFSSMSDYINSLITKDQKRVERGNK